MMKKLFVLLIKYMPTIQLVGMLVNNNFIKDKKAKIVEEANKEAELFKKFQIATQANPNLTYAEFIKNVNGKDAKAIYDKHVRNINREITYWDVYVAVNAQYHDYVRLYQDWFPNLTEEQLDEKVIYSAINFWFKDEDAGTGKVWNYFKEI